MAEEEKEEGKRYLSWTCILYPESMPENWREILNESHCPWACSPLHSKDIDKEGKPKKAHYHLLLAFRSVKAYKQVLEITTQLNAARPEPCKDTRGLIRYFTHKDNPEKAQYDEKDIIAGGGFDLEKSKVKTEAEEENIIDKMCDLIEELAITEFFQFNLEVRKNHPEWRKYVRKYSYYFSQIIRSQRHILIEFPPQPKQTIGDKNATNQKRI